MTREENDFIIKMSLMTEDERNYEMESNYNLYLKSFPDGEYKILLLKKIWGVYNSGLKKSTEVKIGFSQKEIDFLKSLPTDEIKRIFYSLMCKAKVRPHESGWIRLDFAETMRYGFPENKAKKMKIDCLSKCREYGFDARVIGSNEPMVCFMIPHFDDKDTVITIKDSDSLDKYKEVVK